MPLWPRHSHHLSLAAITSPQDWQIFPTVCNFPSREKSQRQNQISDQFRSVWTHSTNNNSESHQLPSRYNDQGQSRALDTPAKGLAISLVQSLGEVKKLATWYVMAELGFEMTPGWF